MSVQVSIDAYFKTKSSVETDKKHKVMKRHSLSLIKPRTPVKSTKIDEDVTIVENVMTIVDLSSDDESPAVKTEPTSNSQVSLIHVGTSSSSMSTHQYNLTPKTPIKSSISVKHENTPLTGTETNSYTHEPTNCRLDSVNISQPRSTATKPSTSSVKPIMNNFTLKSQKDEDVSDSLSQSSLSDAWSSNSSSSTILYTLTPPLQTPEKSQKKFNFKSPSSSAKKYYSPNKKRPVTKKSPVKRSLAHDFASTINEDEVLNEACEGMDDKSMLTISYLVVRWLFSLPDLSLSHFPFAF